MLFSWLMFGKTTMFQHKLLRGGIGSVRVIGISDKVQDDIIYGLQVTDIFHRKSDSDSVQMEWSTKDPASSTDWLALSWPILHDYLCVIYCMLSHIGWIHWLRLLELRSCDHINVIAPVWLIWWYVHILLLRCFDDFQSVSRAVMFISMKTRWFILSHESYANVKAALEAWHCLYLTLAFLWDDTWLGIPGHSSEFLLWAPRVVVDLHLLDWLSLWLQQDSWNGNIQPFSLDSWLCDSAPWWQWFACLVPMSTQLEPPILVELTRKFNSQLRNAGNRTRKATMGFFTD